jgi:uncharacterized protein|tara:strand:+ start:2577 stop:2804 length:228 start_codon:yes stop_codon:yes gene_type:complete
MHPAKCPECNAATTIGGNNHSAPFCSKRCQDLDFGAWANEKYILPEQKLSTTLLAENIYNDIITDINGDNSEYGE